MTGTSGGKKAGNQESSEAPNLPGEAERAWNLAPVPVNGGCRFLDLPVQEGELVQAESMGSFDERPRGNPSAVMISKDQPTPNIAILFRAFFPVFGLRLNPFSGCVSESIRIVFYPGSLLPFVKQLSYH